MRTPKDLIKELDPTASSVLEAALVIGFPDTTICVWSRDPNRLDKLRTSIELGGQAIGYITVGPGKADVFPLAEYDGQEWAVKYLERMMEDFA